MESAPHTEQHPTDRTRGFTGFLIGDAVDGDDGDRGWRSGLSRHESP